MSSPTPGQSLINGLTASGTVIVAHLANSFTTDPGEPLPIANILECTFPGYAPVVINDWQDVNPGSTEAAEVLSAVIQFIAGQIVTPQEAWGFYVTSQIGTNPATILALEAFEEPFVFENPLDTLQRQVRVLNSLDVEPTLDMAIST